MDQHEKYMRLALSEAMLAYERNEVPVGAVVVSKGRVIARGHNLTETLNDVTAHAEMQAITAASSALGGKYLQDCSLYVTLEPCLMCAGAIAWSQLGELIYGCPDEKKGFSLQAPDALHPKTKVISGILAEECAKALKDFFRNKR